MRQLQLGKTNLDEFAGALLALAQQDRNILVVTGDSRGSGKLVPFGKALPDQIVEVGIAEQNLVGIASGLAAGGKKVYAVSPSCFMTARSLEQIKNDIAYSNHPVKLIGISAGVSYGNLGTTHHSLHDYASLLAIHNIDIVTPADNFETRQAILASVEYPRPLYIRFGKKPMFDLHQPGQTFQIGKAIPIMQGTDLVFVTTGEPTWRAVEAAQLLRAEGVSAGVLSMHTLRPFDEEAFIELARRVKVIITVEEHSINGGLGSLCAALLMRCRLYLPLQTVAIPDAYIVTGSQDDIFQHYGFTPQALAATAIESLHQAGA